MKIQTKRVIDSFDLDDLVVETYNKPYCFQQQDDCKPRGMHSIKAYKKEYDENKDYYPENMN